MDPQSFEYILALLKDNPIFHNKSTSPQTPVDQQLKLALYKLANDGSASGSRHSSNYWGELLKAILITPLEELYTLYFNFEILISNGLQKTRDGAKV